MKYQPLRSLSNLIPINARFRALYEAVGELVKRVSALEDGGATTSDESEQSFVEPPKESSTVGSWRDIEDAGLLKEYAFAEYGLEIKGNKKADTIIREIECFLEAKED